MIERRLFPGLTTCSKDIVITIDLPKSCRLNMELLEERIKEIFRRDLLRDLCQGCPLESELSSSS